MLIHNISEVALKLGPVEVRYYSLMFACGVLGYYFLTHWLWKRRKVSTGKNWPLEDFDTLVVFLFMGLVVGARLGEVFFYHPSYYLSQPVEILKIWNGGLSSHGATIGLLLAYTCFWGWKRMLGRKKKSDGKLKFSEHIDILAICMPLVAGFVRMGNFFNSEIVGRTTSLPWGVVFARNGEEFARHPVQLYEGFWAWIVFAALIWLWLKQDRWTWLRTEGFFVFSFIGLYFAGRFGIEFFKEYQVLAADGGWTLGLTMGQWLSVVPILIAVSYFVFFYPILRK